jgi:hypothetical protein
MHHVPYDEHARIAQSLWRCLRSGAICLVKDMARTPTLQYAWNRLHDRLSAGPEPIYCRDPEDMTTVFESVGFVAEGARRMTKLGLYPHYLVSLRKV